MKWKLALLFAILSLFFEIVRLQAQAPNLLNYQGRLISGNNAASGSFNITFSIYNAASGGELLWAETQAVTVTNGQFNVLLGRNVPFSSALFNGIGDRYLGVKVENDSEISPRFQLVSAAFALRASQADGVADNAITSSKIQDMTVGVVDLANNAVATEKIADGAVTQAKLAANVALPPAGPAGGDLSGTYPNPAIANNAVTAAKIAGDAVVKSINGVRDNVTLAQGSNVSIAVAGNTLTISATPGGNGGDITAVNAGVGLTGGGMSGEVTLALNTSVTDGLYVNEGQLNSISSNMIPDNAVTANKISPNIVSSINNVSNDGGNINLVAGNSNVTIVSNDANDTITISATGSGNLSLPFSGTISSSIDAFSVVNEGAGRAGAFEVNNPGNNVSALLGKTNSNNIAMAAVQGVNTGEGHGGLFEIDNPSNGNVALEGKTNGTGYAGYFHGDGGSSKGVYISVPANQPGLMVASGSKNAVVATSQGARLLYSEEASEVWFTDYGFGRLENGQAVVAIDPFFAETVNLNESYHVFVQAYGNAELYVSQRTATAFTVLLRDGDDQVDFSYRLVAKRRGYERTRLERAPWAEDDPNLYPERRADWEAKHKGNR